MKQSSIKPKSTILSPTSKIRLLYGLHSILSLAYEILWIRMISPRLGTSQAALGTVLACFVAGLAIGSWIISWIKIKRKHNWRLIFIICQISLGIWALILPFVLPVLDSTYVLISPPEQNVFHYFARAVIAGGYLLPPSILIGMIFPLLSGWLEPLSKNEGQITSSLYKDGLIASAIGAGIVPTLLLSFWGLSQASRILAVFNFLIAAIAYFSFSNLKPSIKSVLRQGASPLTKAQSLSFWTLNLGGFLIGFVLFAIEISAAHFLWLTVNDTFYVHAILVAEVLLFMGLGALGFIKNSFRLPPKKDQTAHAVFLMAVWLLGWLLAPKNISDIYQLVNQTFYFIHPIIRFFTGHLILIGAILAVPSFMAGWVFTSYCAKAAHGVPDTSTSVGQLVGWNYMGAMLGSIISTFIFIPFLGPTWALAIAGILLCVILILTPRMPSSDDIPQYLKISCGILPILFLMLAYKTNVTYPQKGGPPFHQNVYHSEDETGIVEVYEDLNTGVRRLYTSRLRMEGDDSQTEIILKKLQGALPVVLHPAPQSVLVVGLGTGISLNAHLSITIKDLTCVEYSPSVIDAAGTQFSAANQNVLGDPRVSVINQDGRNYLRLDEKNYDLIIQDLFFPYQTGISYLYTREHFQVIKNRLNPGGCFAQWLPLHQMDGEEIKTIINTFQEVFPESTAWILGRYLLLYGGMNKWNWENLKNRIELHPALSQFQASNILSIFMGGSKTLSSLASDASSNTDDNILIERKAPLLLDQLDTPEVGFQNLFMLGRLRENPNNYFESSAKNKAEYFNRIFESQSMYYEAIEQVHKNNKTQARIIFSHSIQKNRENYFSRAALANYMTDDLILSLRSRPENITEAINEVQKIKELDPHSLDAVFLSGLLQYDAGYKEKAYIEFRHLITLAPRFYNARLRFADIMVKESDRQNAMRHYQYVYRNAPSLLTGHVSP